MMKSLNTLLNIAIKNRLNLTIQSRQSLIVAVNFMCYHKKTKKKEKIQINNYIEDIFLGTSFFFGIHLSYFLFFTLFYLQFSYPFMFTYLFQICIKYSTLPITHTHSQQLDLPLSFDGEFIVALTLRPSFAIS